MSAEGQLPQELQELLEKVAVDEGLGKFKVTLQAGAGCGDSFMSDMVKVRLDGERGHLSLVLKSMPPQAHELTQARRDVYYVTELAMYGKVLPAMRRLHEEMLPAEERFLGVAKFHGGTAKTLALQDMSVEGYRLADRRAGLDTAHCRLVVRELGRLHALSLALRDRHPADWERLVARLGPEVFVRPVLCDYLRGMARHAEVALLRYFTPDSPYVLRLRDSVPHLVADLNTLVTREAAEPHVVIGHGDCWTSNYLFKYAEDGVTPVAACMVDLQIARCSSPLNDLTYFLSASASCGTLQKSYDILTAEYYNSLSSYLRQLGSDPDRLFPVEAFQDHEKRFSKLGLCLALMYMPVYVANPGTTFNLEFILKHPEQLGDDMLNELYAQRITDLVVHMVDHGFI